MIGGLIEYWNATCIGVVRRISYYHTDIGQEA